ncbi:hypothetical protein, partial [Escherichia coli]|uniref:hypothetical protein n=1 Tax=Escherichia coli TaxID=562 RepID=UPI001BDC96B3
HPPCAITAVINSIETNPHLLPVKANDGLFSVEQLASVRVRTIDECAKVCDDLESAYLDVYGRHCSDAILLLKEQKK